MTVKRGVHSQVQRQNIELLSKCSSYPLKQSQKEFVDKMFNMIKTGYGIVLTPREEEVVNNILKQYEPCSKKVILVRAKK